MAYSSTRPRPKTILYAAQTKAVARDGATALERMLADATSEPDSGSETAVHPVNSIEQLRERAPEADCVVFEEPGDEDSPSSGRTDLLEVVNTCGGTPLVVFTDESYASATARSADEIAGYVRRSTEDALVHLVDEIAKVYHGNELEEFSTGARRKSDERSPGSDSRSQSAKPSSEDSSGTTTLLQAAARIADCRDRELVFEQLIDEVVEVLGFEYCWIATVNFGDLVPRETSPAIPEGVIGETPVRSPFGEAFRTGEPSHIDLSGHDVFSMGESARSLYSVPVGDVGVLQVVVDADDIETGGTDEGATETDLVLLESLCGYAATILERNWTELGLINDRDRIKRQRDRLAAKQNLFADACKRLENERDRLTRLFEQFPDPAARYEVKNGTPLIQNVNDAFTEAFGDDESVVGKSLAEFTVPDGLEKRTAELEEALRTDGRQLLVHRRETVGGPRDFVLTVVPLQTVTDDDGQSWTESGLLVFDDVTKRKRRELELAAATARLEAVTDHVDEEALSSLNTAQSYLELAEKTGKEEHFTTTEEAHDQLEDTLEGLREMVDEDGVEPVAVSDVAQHAWTTVETGDARLVTENDIILEADRERLHELFEYVLETAVSSEQDDVAGTVSAPSENGTDPVTITVGATEDGFYVAGDRPTAKENGNGRQEAPTPGQLDGTDGSGLQLDLVERIAEDHGWDVGVAEDDDGTAFAFRGVEAIDLV